jgi:hypothetical protein
MGEARYCRLVSREPLEYFVLCAFALCWFVARHA